MTRARSLGIPAFVNSNGTICADGFVADDFRAVCMDLAVIGWRRRATVTVRRPVTFEKIGEARIADVIAADDGDPIRDPKWWHARANAVTKEDDE